MAPAGRLGPAQRRGREPFLQLPGQAQLGLPVRGKGGACRVHAARHCIHVSSFQCRVGRSGDQHQVVRPDCVGRWRWCGFAVESGGEPDVVDSFQCRGVDGEDFAGQPDEEPLDGGLLKTAVWFDTCGPRRCPFHDGQLGHALAGFQNLGEVPNGIGGRTAPRTET